MDLKDVIKVAEDHEVRLSSIEVNRGMVEVQIQNLIKSVDQLTDSIKLMLFGALGIGIGFIIWYVQKI